MTPYAVKHNGEWFLCHLVPATDYDTKAHFTDPPVWCQTKTTAYICEYTEAETVINLENTDA